MSSEETLLSIRDLSIGYRVRRGLVNALTNVSLDVPKNSVVAVVGESGCGKSTLGLSIIRLLPEQAVARKGSIIYRGINLLDVPEKEFRKFRGTEISMIFQEPLSSLNPVYTVGEQILEAIQVRVMREMGLESIRSEYKAYDYSKDQVLREVPKGPEKVFMPRLGKGNPKPKSSEFKGEIIELLRLVRIPDPEVVMNRYPHQLSGGMRQRVMIAMALAERPKLLIADEPTTALDVTTQAQILKLLLDLVEETGMSMLLITHDLGIVAETADRVAVMYAGMVVEEADVYELFENPLHPYTKALLNSLPRGYYDSPPLESLPGNVPDLVNPPPGCRFHPRCKYAKEICKKDAPPLVEVKPGHRVACFLYSEGGAK